MFKFLFLCTLCNARVFDVDDSLKFVEPHRPPFRAGWNVPTRLWVKTLCMNPPETEATLPIWPLYHYNGSGPYHSYTGSILSNDKPNPDAIPICEHWTNQHGTTNCPLACQSRLETRCSRRPQLWKYYEWRTPTQAFHGSRMTWNGIFDCVAEVLHYNCAGPCRSASNPEKEAPCHIPRDRCLPAFIDSDEDFTSHAESTIESSASTDSTTEGATESTETSVLTTTTCPSTLSSTNSEENIVPPLSESTKETTEAGTESNGWNAGHIIGSTVISAGGAAAGVGLCCHCTGTGGEGMTATAEMLRAPGIKDFGTTLGGGADDVARMAREKCEIEEDRAGNKEAMEAELAARMSVAMTVSGGMSACAGRLSEAPPPP